MVRGELLNSGADVSHRGFYWLTMHMQPGQPEMIRIAEFGAFQLAGMERREKFLVSKMRRSQDTSHFRIVAKR